ncbi:MAG: two-component sensor histidine kinase, partial [Bacillus sp. (in: Bacteria)]|nr:two-component sensor histidine kinase [Bacillus sp. (in: firmicutes)]
MKENNSAGPKLIFEEKKAIIFFLWLFYLLFFSFDIFYKFLTYFKSKEGLVLIAKDGLGIWLYIFILSLLPLAIYLMKKENPYIIKYLLLFGFLTIDIFDNLFRYYGTSIPFSSGNIVEVLFIFFAPIFVNKKYFWTVSLGLIGKDIILGLILWDFTVSLPILVFLVLSALSYL